MVKPQIHPTAIVSPTAVIGDECVIGPYSIIGEHVKIGARCRLHSHVVLDGYTTVGNDCQFYPFCCVGKKTQDLKYKAGDISFVEIGDGNVIREYVTVHMATGAGNRTSIGNQCLIQAYCHVAHECRLGNHVIMSSGAMLAGHVDVQDYAIIGGLTGVVQFVRIGAMAMVGGFSKLAHDVLPYTIAEGAPAEMRTINKIGMTRNRRTPATIRAVGEAFKKLILSGQTLGEAVAATSKAQEEFPEVQAMITFAEQSQRGLARPKPRKATSNPG